MLLYIENQGGLTNTSFVICSREKKTKSSYDYENSIDDNEQINCSVGKFSEIIFHCNYAPSSAGSAYTCPSSFRSILYAKHTKFSTLFYSQHNHSSTSTHLKLYPTERIFIREQLQSKVQVVEIIRKVKEIGKSPASHHFTSSSLNNIKRDIDIKRYGARDIDAFIRVVESLRSKKLLFTYVMKYPNKESTSMPQYPKEDPLFVFSFSFNINLLKKSKFVHCMSDDTHNFCKWDSNLKLITIMTRITQTR